MDRENRAVGWLRGLTEGPDIPVELVDLEPPSPNRRELRVSLKSTPDVASRLKNLHATKEMLPRFSLVVREDERTLKDREYSMSRVLVGDVDGLDPGWTAIAVRLIFDRLEMVAGVKLNPGTPPGAPEIVIDGPNSGWVYDSTMSTLPRGDLMGVLDYGMPRGDGRLMIWLRENSTALTLLEDGAASPELVVVLPDRVRRRYVEFRLLRATVKVAAERAGWRAVLESPWIECLTGEEP